MTGELVRWCALVTLLAVGCWAAPHAKDVDPESLITKPDLGNQFVHFQTKQAKSRKEPEFATSHKIPGRDPPVALEAEEAEYAASLKVKHVKREAVENERNSSNVEYKVVTSMSQHSSEDDGPIRVEIKADAGLLADKQASEDELKIMSTKKATSLPEGTKKLVLKEKQQDNLNAEFTAESETGVQNPKFHAGPEDISLLPSKMPESESAKKNNFEVVPVNLPKGKSHGNKDDVDFVDSPFADKVLVPAGAGNQQSRIEIKKGPNGQDYEYEYVYYYEDEEDAADAPAPSTTSTTPSSRRYLPTESSSAAGGANSRGGSDRGKSRQSSQGSEAGADDRKRYTNIERTTSPVPEVNEVVPSRGGGRHRGRNLSTSPPETTTEDVAERLPSNTRFPPRSRGSAAAATTTPAATPSTVSRTRGGSSGGSVRRPSLELVDSQSFRTHSSSSGEPDQPSFPSVLPADPAPVTEDLDDSPPPQRRPTIRRPPSSTSSAPVSTDEIEDEDDEPPPSLIGGGGRTPEFSPESTFPQSTDEPGLSTAEQPVENPDGLSAMMDKAALELYAALQQASLNSLDPAEAGDPEGIYTTELDLTTTPEPTTTTTTPIPTTTTTTTTEAPTTTTEAPVGRRNGPKARRPSRFKSSGSTTTTTEPSLETSTRTRARFGANKNGNGFGGRKAGGRTTPKPLEDSAAEGANEKESTKEPAPTRSFSPNRFNSGTSRRRGSGSTTSAPTTSGESGTTHSVSKPAAAHHDRYNIRPRRPGRVTTPAAPVEEEHDEEGSSQTSESTAAPTKPATRARVNLANGNRLSLRPGPRLNLGRPGASTSPAPSTTPPPAENEGETEEEENHNSSPENEDNVTTTPVPALTRLRNRPRLRVQPKASPAASNSAPIRRGPSPLLRKKQNPAPEAAEEKAPQTEEKEEGENEETNKEESVGSEAETTPAAETPAASEPKGLSGLLAGRRRIPGGRIRTPGTLAQRAP